MGSAETKVTTLLPPSSLAFWRGSIVILVLVILVFGWFFNIFSTANGLKSSIRCHWSNVAQQYYATFDDATQRGNLINFYNADSSLMTFEGQQLQGAQRIMEKFNGLTFQKICHIITKVDCQPMFDGGILINVLGQLKTDDEPPHSFSQTFVLKPLGESFFLQHDIFRLGIHSN